MKKNLQMSLGLGSLVAASGLLALALLPRAGARGLAPRLSPEAKAASEQLEAAQRSLSRRDVASATGSFTRIIGEHKYSPDKDCQDIVTKARMSLGYLAADSNDWKKAETAFETAAHDYRGTGGRSPGFGALDEQAAYQAAVCVQAEGKTQEALSAFRKFLSDHASSPLVFAAHDRLVKLDPVHRSLYDKELQAADLKRQAVVRLELASCGPRVIRELLKRTSGKNLSEEHVRSLCKTDKTGTSMKDMATALSGLGWRATGKDLNLDGFRSLKAPAVWLQSDHYLLVVANDGGKLTVYDPFLGSDGSFDTSRLDPAKFRALVLELDKQTETS